MTRMNSYYKIRLITEDDIAAALEVYKPYVLNTAITFEYEVPTIAEFTHKVKTISTGYPWLVCEHNNEIIGYAYGSLHRARTAYTWSPESTVYMDGRFHGRGVARVLYETLFEILKLQGYINVYAGVGIPNEKSEAFHEALGFYELGIFRKVGYKLGKWHDTRWFQLHLAEHVIDPPWPKQMDAVVGTDEFNSIMLRANEKMKLKQG